MSRMLTAYPVQPGTAGNDLNLEEVATDSNAGESSRAFAARHLDGVEARMASKPLWVSDHEATIRPILHGSVVGGVQHNIQVAHKKGEMADQWAPRALEAIARWQLAHPADV